MNRLTAGEIHADRAQRTVICGEHRAKQHALFLAEDQDEKKATHARRRVCLYVPGQCAEPHGLPETTGIIAARMDSHDGTGMVDQALGQMSADPITEISRFR